MTAPFSLLLPVYAGDDADALRLAVTSSVDEQTRPPAELVLVQDGPVGDLLAAEIDRLVEECPAAVTHVVLPRNGGLTAALNAGLAACSHDIVARIDADDFSVPERFAKQLGLLEAGHDLVGSGMFEFADTPAEPGAARVPPVGAERIREHAKTHNPFNHPTMVYRRSVLAGVGNYQEFGQMEDYWLGIRLIDSGARVANLPEPLVGYRVGAGAFARRGGWAQARTEWRLQRELRRMGFISTAQFLRNSLVKGAYRLIPTGLRERLFHRFVAGGLPGDRAAG